MKTIPFLIYLLFNTEQLLLYYPLNYNNQKEQIIFKAKIIFILVFIRLELTLST
jgi:hypothetical protein